MGSLALRNSARRDIRQSEINPLKTKNYPQNVSSSSVSVTRTQAPTNAAASTRPSLGGGGGGALGPD